jgi:hypothetical protein
LWWSQTCQTNRARMTAQVPHADSNPQLDVQWSTDQPYAWSGSASANAVITTQFYAPVALAGAWGKVWASTTAGFTGCATQMPPDFLCG